MVTVIPKCPLFGTINLNSAVAVNHKDRKEHKESRLQRLQFGMITHSAVNPFLTELRSKFLSMCFLCSLWLNELPFLGLTVLNLRVVITVRQTSVPTRKCFPQLNKQFHRLCSKLRLYPIIDAHCASQKIDYPHIATAKRAHFRLHSPLGWIIQQRFKDVSVRGRIATK